MYFFGSNFKLGCYERNLSDLDSSTNFTDLRRLEKLKPNFVEEAIIVAVRQNHRALFR